MGNIAPRAGVETTFLALQASVQTNSPHRLPVKLFFFLYVTRKRLAVTVINLKVNSLLK